MPAQIRLLLINLRLGLLRECTIIDLLKEKKKDKRKGQEKLGASRSWFGWVLVSDSTRPVLHHLPPAHLPRGWVIKPHFSILSPYSLHSSLKSSKNPHNNKGSVPRIPIHSVLHKISLPLSPPLPNCSILSGIPLHPGPGTLRGVFARLEDSKPSKL